MIPCCIFLCQNEPKVPVIYGTVAAFSEVLHIVIRFCSFLKNLFETFKSFQDASKIDLKGRPPNLTHFNKFVGHHDKTNMGVPWLQISVTF